MKKKYQNIIASLLIIPFFGCTLYFKNPCGNHEHRPWDQREFETLEKKWNAINDKKARDSLSHEDHQVLSALFKKSVDARNPRIDYQKSRQYAKHLLEYSQFKDISIHNWVAVLDRIASMQTRIDQLEQIIPKLNASPSVSEKEQMELKRKLTRLKKENQDLTDKIFALDQKIEKLKELEIFIRDNRKNFNYDHPANKP